MKEREWMLGDAIANELPGVPKNRNMFDCNLVLNAVKLLSDGSF